ncbi:MAG: type II toxin-antitoxin system prevent-host-death family antitoxin [Micromonosporaceae bacterium]
MERKMSATEARVHFGEVLESVKRGDIVYVEKSGRPQAVIVPVEEWERDRQREGTWDRTLLMMEASRRELAEKYGSDAFKDFDVDREIDAGWEERDRAILGDLLP